MFYHTQPLNPTFLDLVLYSYLMLNESAQSELIILNKRQHEYTVSLLR